jgi:hypothetical protein
MFDTCFEGCQEFTLYHGYSSYNSLCDHCGSRSANGWNITPMQSDLDLHFAHLDPSRSSVDPDQIVQNVQTNLDLYWSHPG